MKLRNQLLPEKYAALQMGFWMDYLVIFSFAAVFLKGRGFSATEIGYVTTSGAVLTILLQMSVSSLADRAKRITLKEIIIAIIAGCITAAGVMIVVPKSHLVTFACMFIVLSLTNTLSPLLTSLCLQYNEGDTRINYGVTRSLGSLGYALAAFVMGRVTERFGAEIVLPVYCVIYVLMLLLVTTMPRPIRYTPSPAHSGEKPAEEPNNILRFFRQYRRYDLFLLAVMAMFFMPMIMNTYMIYFVNSFGGGEAEMGTALFVSAFAEMPAVALGLTLLKRFSPQTLLRVSSIASLVKTGALLFIPDSRFFIGLQALQFFCSGIYMVSSVYFISSIIRRVDGVKAQSIMAVGLSGVSGIAGNILGGYMIEHVSIRAIIVMGTIIAMVGVALMFVATSEKWGSAANVNDRLSD